MIRFQPVRNRTHETWVVAAVHGGEQGRFLVDTYATVRVPNNTASDTVLVSALDMVKTHAERTLGEAVETWGKQRMLLVTTLEDFMGGNWKTRRVQRAHLGGEWYNYIGRF